MSERRPAHVFDPREYVRDELAERGMIEDDVPAIVWEWLFADQALLTPRVAESLSALFGTSAQMWLNLERVWQEWR